MEKTLTGAEAIHWDLTDLYPDTEALEAALAQSDQEADAFAEHYRGQVASLSAAELAEALGQFEDVQDQIGCAYTYAFLNWSTNTTEAERAQIEIKLFQTLWEAGLIDARYETKPSCDLYMPSAYLAERMEQAGALRIEGHQGIDRGVPGRDLRQMGLQQFHGRKAARGQPLALLARGEIAELVHS